MARYELPRPRTRKRALRITLFVVILLLLLGARTIASTVIDYQWWKELGQVDTWLSLYLYAIGPLLAATMTFWVAAGTRFAVAVVVSQSSGSVRLFQNGEMVLHIEPLDRPLTFGPVLMDGDSNAPHPGAGRPSHPPRGAELRGGE